MIKKDKLYILNLILYSLLIIIACDGVGENPENTEFTPPDDKIVTREMAKRYAKVSVALTEAVEKEASRIDEFRNKYKISLEMGELKDPEFRKNNPEAIKEWNKIQENWKGIQDSIYREHDMSEEEWDWIAEALILPRNRPMQKFIRKEIDKLESSQSQPEKQTTDSK